MFLKLFISKCLKFQRHRDASALCFSGAFIPAKKPTGAHPEDLNVLVRWIGERNKHPNYFHHDFFMVPLVASTFGHFLPGF
jgi:hypothetical protein